MKVDRLSNWGFRFEKGSEQREVSMEKQAWTTPELVSLDTGFEEKHLTFRETIASTPDEADGES